MKERRVETVERESDSESAREEAVEIGEGEGHNLAHILMVKCAQKTQ